MNYMSVGDMAQTYQMRRHNTQLKEHLGTLTSELTTGTRVDLSAAVSGDFTALAGIDRSLATLDAHALVTSEARLFTSAAQASLEKVHALTSDIGTTLIGARNASPAVIDATAGDVRQRFLSAVSALNTQVGERFLFSGSATDTAPLVSGAAILSAVTTAVAGETTASGVEMAIDDWFNAPAGAGGFLDLAYGGSDVKLAGFRIGPDATAEFLITAADPVLRDTLKSLAMAAVLSEGALAGNFEERRILASAAGARILTSEGQLTTMRATVGVAEGQIDDADTRNVAEASALKVARSGIIAADPYDTASALQAVQTQMETLYTLTARLSRLSLADYL